MAQTLQNYYGMSQDPLARGIVKMFWESAPIATILNFITDIPGFSYPYTKKTKRSAAGTRPLNGVFPISEGQTAPDVETMSIIGGKGRADTMMLEFKPNMLDSDIADKIETSALAYSRMFVTGNPAVSGDPTEFYGLYPRVLPQMKFAIGPAPAPVRYKAINALLDSVAGPDSQKVLVMNRTVRRNLSEEIGDSAGQRNLMQVGEMFDSYRNAKIWMPDKDDREEEVLPFNEAFAGATNTSSVTCFRLGGSNDEQHVQGLLARAMKVSPILNTGEAEEQTVQMLAGMGVFGRYDLAQINGIIAA